MPNDASLAAIREDRTRGGRSTYQCSYTLPPSLTTQQHSSEATPHGQASLRMEEDEDNDRLGTTVALQSAQEEEIMEDAQLTEADMKNVPLLIQVRPSPTHPSSMLNNA